MLHNTLEREKIIQVAATPNITTHKNICSSSLAISLFSSKRARLQTEKK